VALNTKRFIMWLPKSGNTKVPRSLKTLEAAHRRS
jgi:hypothetical protein